MPDCRISCAFRCCSANRVLTKSYSLSIYFTPSFYTALIFSWPMSSDSASEAAVVSEFPSEFEFRFLGSKVTMISFVKSALSLSLDELEIEFEDFPEVASVSLDFALSGIVEADSFCLVFSDPSVILSVSASALNIFHFLMREKKRYLAGYTVVFLKNILFVKSLK